MVFCDMTGPNKKQEYSKDTIHKRAKTVDSSKRMNSPEISNQNHTISKLLGNPPTLIQTVSHRIIYISILIGTQ